MAMKVVSSPNEKGRAKSISTTLKLEPFFLVFLFLVNIITNL